jgi:microcystin-dependent protein
MQILSKRSSTADKRPDPANLANGELAINFNDASSNVFYKNSAGGLNVVGAASVSALAPNSSPAGYSGNSPGEFWYDTTVNILKIFDGSTWQQSGGAVQGVTGVAPISVNNTDPYNPIISVTASSTSAAGVVQLNATVSSTSTTQALAASQGKFLQDQISALTVASGLNLAGTLNASTGLLITVTVDGSSAGFAIGDPLPSPSSTNSDFFVIVTTAGTFTPPGGSSVSANSGDWFLSDGTVWQYLATGGTNSPATTTSPGVVELATDAETQVGVDSSRAVTPSALQSKLSNSTSTTSSTTIASSTAVKSAYDLAVSAGSAASAAQTTADAALARSGGTMTGGINLASSGVTFNDSSQLIAITDSTSTTSSTTAASATAVKSAYDLANTALPKTGGTMTGAITFGTGQTFPVCGIQNACTTQRGVVCLVDSVFSTCIQGFAATPASVKCAYDTANSAATTANAALPLAGGTVTGTINFSGAGCVSVVGVQSASLSQRGLVQIGDNIQLSDTGGIISVNPASTSGKGVVQLCDSVTSVSSTFAATPYAVNCAYRVASCALPLAGGTMTGTICALNICVANNSAIGIGGGCITGISDSQNCNSSTIAASAKSVCATNYEMATKVSCYGGTMTGTLSLCTALGAGICFLGSGMPAIVGFSDNYLQTNSDIGATSKAVACTYVFASTMLPKCGGTMTGDIVFNSSQVFPVSGIQNATATQKGIVQIGSNIQVSSGTISVNAASTTQEGVVQLEDSTSSTSTTLALTANQGKILQDEINALVASGGTVLAGTIDASTGLMQTVTSNGTAKGFVVGQAMPAASNSNKNYYTIASVAGTMTPPGGASTAVDVGDWWLSVSNGGNQWDLLQVGYHAPDATTTVAGVVKLSTDALAQAGVDATTAVTPHALQSKLSDSISTTSSTTIASSTAVKCAYDTANAAVPKSAFSSKGDLLAGTSSSTYCALPVGTNGYVLSANSACAAGMEWVVNTGGVSSLTVCPTLCNLGTSTNPVLCAVPAPTPVGICPSTDYGVVKLVNDVLNCSCNLAASAYAVNNAYVVASCALPKSGGTVTGAVTFGCSGLGCPAYLNFSNGIANGQIYGISDNYASGASNVAASTTAVSTVYGIANAALPNTGGTLSGSVCFSSGGVCFGATSSCLTGLTSALNSTSNTLALTAAGGCCLNYLLGRKLDLSGGTLSGNLTFAAGGYGISFTDSSSCLVGITDSISTTASATAASATAVKSAYDKGAAAIPCSAFAAKGNVLAGTAAGTYSALAVGTNGQVLTACSTCTSGVAWTTLSQCAGTVTSITAGTGLTGGTITTSGTIALDTACVVQPTAFTAKGALLTATAASTPTALAVGTDGYVLTANSASSTGLCWQPVGDSPVGAIAFFAMSTAPTGWLVADGSCVSRTTYSSLYAKIGTTYGAGNGTTTFQLPDLRGQFVRGWNSSATGCDPSRTFGSCQSNAFACHCHGITMTCGLAGVPEWFYPDNTSTQRGYAQCGGSAVNTKQRGYSDCFGGSATETRPDNIALLPCIKVGISTALDIDATPTVAGAVLGCTNNLCHNTYIGCNAGAATTAVTACSTSIGKNALCLATGNGNTAVGSGAGSTITTGTNNVAIGQNVAVASATASCQLAIGFSATQNWLTGDSCQNIRPGAGILSTAGTLGTNGQALVACANGCGVCWGTIADSTPVGSIAFFAMSTAPTGWLVADGSCVSRSTYSGLYSAIGTTYGAGDGSTTFQLPDLRGRFARGWNSSATGCDPSRVFGSCQSSCVGPHNHTLCAALGSSTDSSSQGWTPTGGIFATLRTTDRAGLPGDSRTTSAACNVAMACAGCLIGTETRPDNIALLPCIKVGNSSALGVDATPTVAGAVLGCTNNLCHNTLLGCNAGAGISATTCALTAVGKQALTVATGNNNTAIGTYAGCTLTTGANNTLIGFNAAPSTVTVSNEITLGNSSIATIRAQVTTITSLSDARDKTRIRDIPIGLDFLNSIRPVEFEWKMRDGGKVGEIDTGFIAQDLQEVQDEIGYTLPGLVYEANPDRLEAGYGKLLPVLVKAIQELSEKNKELEARLAALEGN